MKPAAWPQQERLRELVAAWRKDHAPQTGKRRRLAPLEDLAPLLQTTVRTLSTYLSPSCKNKPSNEFLERAALFFGVSRAELMDDPFMNLPGGTLDGVSPLKRSAAQRIVSVLADDRLTDDEALEASQRFRDFLDLIIRVKKA